MKKQSKPALKQNKSVHKTSPVNWSDTSFLKPNLAKILLTGAFSTISIFGWITLLEYKDIPLAVYFLFILSTIIIVIASSVAASWIIHASTHSRIMDMVVMQILVILIIMMSAIAYFLMR